jgi:hypothetical protein
MSAEQPGLAGLIAPRGLVESEESDPIFPVEHVRLAVAALEMTYASLGALERFGCDIHPGSHETSGRASVVWLYGKLEE